MCRSLLSAVSIFILAATLLPPGTLATSRCSVKLPTTLLSLYLASDLIYVGTYDRVEEGDVINEADDYREVSINKFFSISAALKGETRKMITLKDTEYHDKAPQGAAEETEPSEDPEPDTDAKIDDDGDEVAESETADPEAAESDESEVTESEAGDDEADDEESENQVRPGDSVLLFMKKDDDSDALVLSDYTDGIKKMTPDKLAAYEVRIRELNEIFGGAKPSYSRI